MTTCTVCACGYAAANAIAGLFERFGGTVMAIPRGHKANLNTLIRAAKAGRLAVVECQEKASGRVVNVLCAISDSDTDEYNIVPFAMMFDCNPYDVLNPPDPNGGFHTD